MKMNNGNINKNYIDGGAFLVARKGFESELWRKKPAGWWKVWCYILGSVQHTKYKELERGEGFFNLSRLSRENRFGNGVTENQVEKFLIYAKRAGMIATQKATQGIVIKVLNYNLYQDLGNYEATPKAETEAEQKRHESDNINKKGENAKNDNQLAGKKEFSPEYLKEVEKETERIFKAHSLRHQVENLTAYKKKISERLLNDGWKPPAKLRPVKFEGSTAYLKEEG